ncbi:MAG: class I SAM-dependent methyltransferase [Deltaproteobacteria bacterium]|nr:class I SAM-dependent methyltransferase [Deltaproteobacteria bacterium]
MSQDVQQFDKYKEKGAYHWKEMRSGIKRFNAGLAGRYEISKRIIFRNCSSPNVIVDIGCGDGFFTATIAERYRSANIIGYDFDETAIRLANEKKEELGYKNLYFHKGDAFEHKDVSLIVATDVIEHLNEPEDFMRKSFTMLGGGVSVHVNPYKVQRIPRRQISCP